MNIETGKLMDAEQVGKLPAQEQSKYIPVVRDLSRQEKARMQLDLYSHCGCGSGKKFKFCCFKPGMVLKFA